MGSEMCIRDRAKERVRLSDDDMAEKGMGDFMVRLAISPSRNPKFVDVIWVTLPVSEENMRNLISPQVARLGRGYPVHFLHKDDPMALGPALPDDVGNCGVSMQPILHYPGSATAREPVELPRAAEVLTGVRAFFSSTTSPRLESCEDWPQATGTNPVNTELLPSEFIWPFEEEDGERDPLRSSDPSTSDGKICYPSQLYGSVCKHLVW